ncbi:MAG: ABC transporter permease, partial [Thermoprotei archaeon ex4572_64]
MCCEKALLPIIEVLASLPVPAYLPMIAALMMISLGKILGLRLVLELIVLISAYLSTAWYVLYNMYSGVKNLPREFWYVCEINKLSFYQKIRKLLIPGAMPAIITGLISTVGGAWGGLQISEYLIIQDKVYSVPGLVALLSHYITLGDIVRVLSA